MLRFLPEVSSRSDVEIFALISRKDFGGEKFCLLPEVNLSCEISQHKKVSIDK